MGVTGGNGGMEEVDLCVFNVCFHGQQCRGRREGKEIEESQGAQHRKSTCRPRQINDSQSAQQQEQTNTTVGH